MASVYAARILATGNTNLAATGTVYATVRQATTTTTIPGGTTISIGQGLSGTSYSCSQFFLSIDTSALSAGQTTAYLYLNCTAAGLSAGGDVLEVRECSATSNLIAGDSLAALTLLGSIPLPTAVNVVCIPLNITSLSRTSTTKVVIHSQRQRTASAPASTDVGAQFSSVSAGTATLRPAMDFDGPWQFRGVSTVVESVTGSATLTLTEPAGAATGDLIVAMISMRSTATAAGTISLPSGWTRVSEKYTNSVGTGSTAVASGTMAWIIRGSSAPSYAFPYGAGNNVIQGQCIAYSATGYTPTIDVNGTGVVTSAGNINVSVTGLTTLTDDALLVVGMGGGQADAFISFSAATSPNVLSGKTASTANPISAWQKRFADNGTASGADTSVALADAMKFTAGATGNFTAIASIAASHLVIAAAFKLGAASGAVSVNVTGQSMTASVGTVYATGPTTFNPIDKKSALVTLSNGNLTVTGTDSGGNNWARSAIARTGKRYVEFTATTVANTVLGIADDGAMTFPGADAKSFGMFSSAAGSIAGTFPTWGPAYATGNVVGMAVDLTAKKVWYRVNGGAWNAGGSADPATGVGGWDVSTYTGATHYVIASGDSGGVTTANFGATSFAATAPAGYMAWDGTPNVSVSLTAMAALTATLGNETVTTTTNVSVTLTTMAALACTQGAEETVVGKSSYTVTGVPAITTSVNDVSLILVSRVNAATNLLTMTAGTADVATTGGVFATVTAMPGMTASLGDETVTAAGNVSVTLTSMAALTATCGDETIIARIPVTVTATTTSALTTTCGDVTVSIVTPTGIVIGAPVGGTGTTLSSPSAGVITITGAGSAGTWRVEWPISGLVVGHTYKVEQTLTGPGTFYASSAANGSGILASMSTSTASNPAYNTFDFTATATTCYVGFTITSTLVTGQNIHGSGSYSGTENNDGTSGLTLGVVFAAYAPVTITGIRFWKTSIDTKTSRPVAIYNSAGATIASATSSGEPVGTEQWITIPLGTPVSMSGAGLSGSIYTAAVYYLDMVYPATANYYTAGHYSSDSKLYALSRAEAAGNGFGGNGLFNYGTGLTPPSGSFNSGDYWIDVEYSYGGTPPSPMTFQQYPTITDLSIATFDAIVTINGGVPAFDLFCRGPASPIAVGNAQSLAYGSRANLTLTPPGVAGDILITTAFIGAGGSPPTITPPSGWTEIFTPSFVSDGAFGGTFYGWWRQQQVGDGAQTFAHTTASSAAWMGAFKNVDGINPIDVQSGMGVGIGTTTTVPSITTIRHVAEMLLLLGHDWDTLNRTPPSGWTETFDSIVYVERLLTTSLTTTGSVSMTNGNTTGINPWQAMQLGLVPNGVTVITANGAIASAVPQMTISMTGVTVSVVFNVSTNVTMPALTATLGDETAKGAANATVTVMPQLDASLGITFVNTAPGIIVSMPALTISVGDVIASVPEPALAFSDPMLISVGDVTVSIAIQVFASGNFMLLSMGDESIAGGVGASPSATMPALTASTSNVSVTGKANVSPLGIPLAISIGDVTVVGKANATITTMPQLTMTLGTVTTGGVTLAIITGMPALTISTADPGGISVNYAVRVIVTGIELTCSIGGQAYVPQVNTPYQREGIMKTMANMMGN